MKNLIILAMVAVALIIFNGCQKDELVLIDEQPQTVVKPDVYVENGYLAFKDFEALDSLKKLLNNSSNETLISFEASKRFKSAYTVRNELMKKADEMSETQILGYLDEVSKRGYFDKESQAFVYPFYNESYSKILNEFGKVKIGNVFYQLKEDKEVIEPDITGTDFKGNPKNLKKEIQLKTGLTQLKSGVLLKETILSDNRLRSMLQLKKEQFVVYDWIIVNGEIVWGVVGLNYEVYYRFYSYKQFLLYKSDRPTYFNWRTMQAQIGGNDGFWYLNYYNANPYLERSPYEAAVYYFVVYGSGLTQTQYYPNVYNVQVSDFWSDYMSSFHGSLIYP